MIRAVAQMDRNGPRIEFDATPFFAQADGALVERVLNEKPGSWDRVAVVRHVAEHAGHEGLSELIDYAIGQDGAISCEIERSDVIAYLDATATAEAEPTHGGTRTSPAANLDAMFEEAAERIGRGAEKALMSRSHFHLAPCGGCGGPAFQQPCSLCGFYPMGAPRPEDRRPAATRDQFVKAVEASVPAGGNLATWYYRSYANSVAYKQSPRFKETIDGLVADAATWRGLPSPQAVFGHVTGGNTIARPQPEGGVPYALWTAIEDVGMAIQTVRQQAGRDETYKRDHGAVARAEDTADPVNDARRHLVRALHGEAPMPDALEDMSEAIGDILRSPGGFDWGASGNLRRARDAIEKAIAELPEESAAPGL